MSTTETESSVNTHGSSSLSGVTLAKDGNRVSTFNQNEVSHWSITASALFKHMLK